MFLPEIPKAVAEIARVLKPDTWVAAAVWSAPEKNPYLRIPIDIIKQFVEIPSPDPTAPGIFRLAKPGDLVGMLQQAGFIDLTEQEFLGDVRFSAADEYFSSLMDIAAPIQNLWTKLNPAQQTEARQRILQTAGQCRKGSVIALPIAVRMVAGRKPG
jgi:hypothetical protein